jgi:hypothetical protein
MKAGTLSIASATPSTVHWRMDFPCCHFTSVAMAHFHPVGLKMQFIAETTKQQAMSCI